MPPNPLVDISIVPFKAKYLPELIELHKSQNYADISLINAKTLPRSGFIAFLNKQPIAAGFLRRLEPCYGQLDTLVSHAHFGRQIRHMGISLVVDALLQEAKDLKLEGIISMTADEGILSRAKDLGFHQVNQAVIALALPTD